MGNPIVNEVIGKKKDLISVTDLLRMIIRGKRIILFTVIAFLIIGLIIGFGSEERYNTKVRLLPEFNSVSSNATSSFLKQIGGITGMNMGAIGTDQTLRPDIYPEIIKSTPFLIYMMDQKIKSPNTDSNLTFYNYFEDVYTKPVLSVLKDYTIGLPKKIKNWAGSPESTDHFRSNQDLILLSINEQNIADGIGERINSDIDIQTGIISISVSMPDPYISAVAAQYSLNYLKEYIIRYRIEKAQFDLAFIQERYTESEEKFHQAQQELALFRDQNKNIVTARFKTREENLETRYNLAFELYRNLAHQVEQARIRVREETPVFKILEPVKIPIERAWPRRGIIMLGALIAGVVLGIAMTIIIPFAKFVLVKGEKQSE